MSYVSVIIPVYNPPHEFEMMLKKLNAQTVKPEKIILLWTVQKGKDRQEEEKKADIYRQDNVMIEYVNQEDFDHGGTRRAGVMLTDSEYVLCMTQDAVPYDIKLIENMCKEFSDEKTAAVYARQLPGKDAGITERITREFNYPDRGRVQNKETFGKYGIKTFFCSNVCAMYKKAYYDEVGGFVKKTIFNEDMIMAASLIDAGYTVKYVPDAKVIHSHNYSYIQQFKRNFDNAVSQKEYPQVFKRVSSESEGVQLVKKTALRLVKAGRIYLLPDMFIQSVFKYLGYRVGLMYNRLPAKLVLKMTMNKYYWI